MVHFVTEANGEVRPLCGEWGGVPNWTKIRSAVSCPRCLELLGDEPEERRAGHAPAGRAAEVIALHPRTGS